MDKDPRVPIHRIPRRGRCWGTSGVTTQVGRRAHLTMRRQCYGGVASGFSSAPRAALNDGHWGAA